MDHDVPGYWKEVLLQALAYFDGLRQIKPQKRSSAAAKPTSVTMIKSMRRVHSYFGISMAPSKLYHRVLKAACDRFIDGHGMSAFLPQQKQPFTNSDIARMLPIPQHFRVHTVLVNSACRLWRSVILLAHVLAQTGMRLGDALRLNSDCLHFSFRELLPLVTQEMLAIMERAATPLFTDTNGGRLKRPFLETVLKSWLRLTGVDPVTHPWHSWRSYLASALKAAGADNSTIKAMVRWVSDKSLKIYARDSRSDYCSWLAKAATASVDAVNLSSLPVMDDDEAHAVLHGILNSGASIE